MINWERSHERSFFVTISSMIYLFLIILGLGLGSFINALVWRIRQQIDDDGEPKKLTKKQQKELSVLTGRSMCPHCKAPIKSRDLIPVISWLLLGGKCRGCKKPISWQYPVVEASVAVLFVVSYVFWPSELAYIWQYLVFANWLIAIVGLIALVIYDIRWMLLPNKILYPLAGVSTTLTAVTFIFHRPVADVRLIALSVLIGGGLFWLIFQFSKGKWIGGGDVKLGLYLGFIVATPNLAFLTLFFASILGTLVAAPLLLSKKISKETRIPFGPFLVAGAFIAMLWGQAIIDWYISLVSAM